MVEARSRVVITSVGPEIDCGRYPVKRTLGEKVVVEAELILMGGEFGQRDEWYHEKSLDWHLLQYPLHAGVQKWVADVNQTYRNEPALYEADFDSAGFEWIDSHDSQASVLSFVPKDLSEKDVILVVCHFTPVPRLNYRIGVPHKGVWKEILNSDAKVCGGRGHGNFGAVHATPIPAHIRAWSLNLTLPPLAALFFKSEG